MVGILGRRPQCSPFNHRCVIEQFRCYKLYFPSFTKCSYKIVICYLKIYNKWLWFCIASCSDLLLGWEMYKGFMRNIFIFNHSRITFWSTHASASHSHHQCMKQECFWLQQITTSTTTDHTEWHKMAESCKEKLLWRQRLVSLNLC